MAKGPVISITLTADDKTKGGFRSATANVEGFGKKVSGGAVALGTFAGNIAAQAVPAVFDFGKELFGLGQKYDTMAKKADTVFGDQAGSIKTWADSVNESFGLADEEVVGLAASMGDLLVPMGFSREAAAGLTTETLDAAAALSAWSGGQYDTAQVSEILTKAMLGERDSLKALGISINQAEVDQRALAIAQAEGRDSITDMDKALATQQLVLEKSTDAQTAWADGTMDSVKAQNEVSAAWADGKAELARGLLPMVNKAVTFIARDFIPKVKELIRTFQEKWPEIRAAVEPIINWFRDTITDVTTVVMALWNTFGSTILSYVKGAFDGIKDVVQGVLSVIQGIIDTVLGVLTGDWAKAWDGIQAIFDGVWQAIKGLLKLALATIKGMIKLAWDAVKKLTSKAWDGIKDAVSNAITGVVNYISGLPGKLWSALSSAPSKLVERGKQFLRGLYDGVTWYWNNVVKRFYVDLPRKIISAIGDVGSTLKTKGWNLLVGFKNGLIDKFNDIRNWVKAIPGRILDTLYNAGVSLKTFGWNLLVGFKNGLIGKWNDIKSWVTDKINWIKDQFKSGFGIFSPSKVFMGYGSDMMKGLAIGLDRGSVRAERALNGTIGSLSVDSNARIMRPSGGSTARGGNTYVNMPAGTRADDVARALRLYERRNGAYAA
jgi:hypothetical protein